MSKKVDRKNEIIKMVKDQRPLSIAELAGHFGVSEMTIRRDIKDLRAENILGQTRGRIYSKAPDSAENLYDLYREKQSRTECKEKIAALAASLIEPHDTVILDAGSTTEHLAKRLPAEHDLTAICYNFNILEQIISRDDLEIVFLGGYYHPPDQMFESPYSTALLDTLRANKVFFSASGVHRSLGITCGHNYEVIVKRSAFNTSDAKYLISDSSKFGKVAGSYFAQLSEMDAVITDDDLSAEWREYIEQDLGLKLYIV